VEPLDIEVSLLVALAIEAEPARKLGVTTARYWYNHEHRHSGIRYVTPAQRHATEDQSILAARHALYQQARQTKPRRWSGPTRNWIPIGAVTPNPERDSVVALSTLKHTE
jgi:hypothetical protein